MDLIIKAFILTIFLFTLYVGFRYLVFSFRMLRGWDRKMTPAVLPRSELPEISVIVCFRNEENNLERLIQCLTQQEYPRQLIEILLVDDHSTDNSSQIASKASEIDFRIHYIPLPANMKGKHAALAEAVKHASYKMLATTDADCIIPEGWLRSMVECSSQKHESLVLGPVRIQAGKNILSKFQALEACAIQTVTGSMTNRHKPIMASGANMLFSRSLLLAYLNNGRYNAPAGLDTLFIHFAKTEPVQIAFNKNPRGIVTTFPLPRFNDFLNQRIRWISKGRHYTDKTARSTMYFLGFVNLLLAFFFAGSFFSPVFRGMFSLIFLFKGIADLLILIPSAKHFRQKNLLWYYLPFALIYPVYILFLTLNLHRSYIWKGRIYH